MQYYLGALIEFVYSCLFDYSLTFSHISGYNRWDVLCLQFLISTITYFYFLGEVLAKSSIFYNSFFLCQYSLEIECYDITFLKINRVREMHLNVLATQLFYYFSLNL